MNERPIITVCGGGSGGMAMAADLSLLGCSVRLYEVPQFARNLEPIHAAGGIHLTGRTFSGRTGLAPLTLVTDDAQIALRDADLVLVNVPAPALEPFLEQLAPHFGDGQVVVVTTGYWAALRARELLRATGAFGRYVFAEMNIMPYLSAKTGPAEADIGNWKRQLYLSAWPAAGNDVALARVRQVYPHTALCKNVLELNFRPGNPGVHPQVTIPKAAFFFERAQVFRFYGEVSLCASRLTDAHDVERMAIAAAYHCETDTWPDDCRVIYELEGDNLYELHGSVTDPHAQKWNQIAEVERLLVEDICYSFIPMEQLGQVVGIPTPVTTAMTEILTVFTGYDYRSNGLDLADLGLDGLDRDGIIRFVTTG